MTNEEYRQLLDWLIAEDVLKGDAPIPTRKPTHGACCTCQDCGHPHDECVCEHNRMLAALESFVEIDAETITVSSPTAVIR